MGATWKEIDSFPTDIQFSVFSSEEVKKLSVVKVITGLTFDPIGRPLAGGLYDPVMGTYGRSMDPCGTCFSHSFCPGHIGHIELNTPVYNPFFIKTLYDILRVSCLTCYKLQIDTHVQKILSLQLELVDAGYITEAQNLELYKSAFAAFEDVSVKLEGSDERTIPEIAKMQELLEKPKSDVFKTKASCAVRSSIVTAALQKPAGKACIHCKNSLKRVKYSYKKLIMSVAKENAEGERRSSGLQNKVILADECKNYIQEIYKHYPDFLKLLFPILDYTSESIPVDIFFMKVVPVVPPKSRPTNVLGNQIIENPQTTLYKNIIDANSVLRLIFVNIKSDGVELQNEAKAVYDSSKGDTPYEKMYFAWQDLQTAVDTLLDVSLAGSKLTSGGLKQILEKKEGLIRKHMMGKRVNYAARTVITPDPNINVEEVGIPDIFARKLSYPVPVTSWNIQELRKMVINGPDVHPGANYIEDSKGHKTIIPADNPAKRQALAKLLLTTPDKGVNIVHRHVLNGDVLLLNRQPTLHRPSIMAHKARILTGEKTFRLHYSNCKAYNADFDGDEMNAHLPQSEVARAEAYNLVNVANSYLVPKDGTPLGGLIQDHVISGVKLSIRGRFFNREDYQQLVFQGLSHLRGNIKLLPPAILKPKRLWSGKQILSTIIINLIPEGYAPINLNSSAKIAAKYWQQNPLHKTTYGGSQLKDIEMSEAEVIISRGELVSGVLDKKQYGATEYGLIHCMYELYGGDVSTKLLTSFTKIFTSFLQREGFTLGVKDILVTAEADKKRRSIIQECRKIGDSVVSEAVNIENPDEAPRELVAEKMAEAYGNDPNFRVILDRKYKSVLDGYTNSINQTCLPAGLIQRFPDNNLQLMVLSGAKGSTVNTMQISCLLGQIELEGKRPPLMISGKSLPSFTESETSPKSGGFIDGRFMTGIQPQDFFFHCMAGREGLIDTAVKTSRSGYLQRCLIKHLEGLSVNYDMTVRDSDNSVVQFMYGEDGMDILKSRFLNKESLGFLDINSKSILHEEELEKIKDDSSANQIKKYQKKLKTWRKKNGDPRAKERMSSFQKFSAELREEIEVEKAKKLNSKTGRLKKDEKIIKLWKKADEEKRNKYISKYSRCPDPVNSKFQSDNYYGSVSEYMEQLIQSYADENPLRKNTITDILHIKSLKSMASPGDPVGLLAAQSIGEPSTQMTLNTFHFAGRGEMNVTLGIPRLREILMMASSNIKTPSMDIPFKPNQVKNSDKLRMKLNRVTLADVLESVKVNHRLVLTPQRAYQYVLTFKFLPKEAYEEDFCVKPKQILKYMSETFFKFMFRAIGRSVKAKNSIVDVGDKGKDKENADGDNDLDKDDPDFKPERNRRARKAADESSDEEGGADDDDDATAIKFKSKRVDDQEYEEPEDGEQIDDKDDDDDDDEDLDGSLGKEDNDNEDDVISKVFNNSMVSNYVYDREKHLWCALTFNLPMKYKSPPDMSSILKQVAKKSVIHEVDKIKRAITYKNKDDLLLKTDGINIVEMFKYHKMLDINRLYSNDIHGIAKTYGIEAAARVIVQEVQNVFKVYGIAVDPRHLSLIADYMTFDGTFKPLSRTGMEFSPSPFQQMSFESSMKFLTSATISGKEDELNSPSSRLMVGLPVKNGTGCFSLLAKFA